MSAELLARIAMSALGQKQTFSRDRAISALPLNADTGNPHLDCQFNG